MQTKVYSNLLPYAVAQCIWQNPSREPPGERAEPPSPLERMPFWVAATDGWDRGLPELIGAWEERGEEEEAIALSEYRHTAIRSPYIFFRWHF